MINKTRLAHRTLDKITRITIFRYAFTDLSADHDQHAERWFTCVARP
jgi:hypothetical protein